ncbi:YggS family pyridoxal phosphate-dependent enzyme [Rikenella microfusus]|uniref:Pyridoxal phosphate homeostasis protein n=1 Tax=Rikenella microfusus TaxID=28139 RepID=A0A379MRG7_9BACT|nr:YggS family pyridoxal phosphate-dependent enzyme [Rikenella microfusus]SUE34324.1 Predicted enzyme with a TIM-barrel fold [Rikenella microfusus]
MGRIADNLARIRETLPAGVTLVAVSKFHPAEALMEAYGAGQRVFGESRPQELAAKYRELPKDIEWHMIGHLQTNKIKYIAPFVSLIHSVDSLKLAEAIDKEAAKAGRVLDVLLQLHVAQEETKFGWDAAELEHFLQEKILMRLEHIRVRGLMGMASLTDDMSQVRDEFRTLRHAFEAFREKYLPEMDILSMGMSGDYPLAVEEGATMVRIGSSIFGARAY